MTHGSIKVTDHLGKCFTFLWTSHDGHLEIAVQTVLDLPKTLLAMSMSSDRPGFFSILKMHYKKESIPKMMEQWKQLLYLEPVYSEVATWIICSEGPNYWTPISRDSSDDDSMFNYWGYPDDHVVEVIVNGEPYHDRDSMISVFPRGLSKEDQKEFSDEMAETIEELNEPILNRLEQKDIPEGALIKEISPGVYSYQFVPRIVALTWMALNPK